MDSIKKYFTKLSSSQIDNLSKLYNLYEDWNSKINVVSRKDFEFFYLKHVLHSLSIAKIKNFEKGSNIIDIGTGGGFPGIPLAILFPESNFTLVDSIKKKIKVVDSIASDLKLNNVKTIADRSENIRTKYDYLISRAVTQFPKFISQTKHLIDWNNKHAAMYYLKGGDFKHELLGLEYDVEIKNIFEIFNEDFFETKKIVTLKKQ